MGQQNSATRHNCVCGCGAWERRGRTFADPTPSDGSGNPVSPTADTSIHRYVSAVTERGCAAWAPSDCACRRRRWPLSLHLRRPRPPCVCTAYRRVAEAQEAAGCSARSTSPDEAAPHCAGQINLLQGCTTCRKEKWGAVLTLGTREARREFDALTGLNTESEGESTTDAATAPEFFLLPVAPHAHPDFNNLDPEDLEERARARRALEIAQGVEAPPGFRSHIQVVCNGEVRALLLRAPPPAPQHRVHTQVDYIHCLVPDLREITACCFYWGKMDRYQAEHLLDNKPEGTFLLRDSAQEEHLFSVSFRKYGRSLHARIEHFNHKFSFDSHDPAVYSASTVTRLIHHYKDPACVMFFEPMLTAPLPRTEPFSLQQLARAVIVSSTTYDGVEELPLPARLRAYLKEYHYRQRVRVRRLDDSLACLDLPHPLPACPVSLCNE